MGAGPGEPDLITVRGLKALRRADAIFYDHRVDRNFLRRFRGRRIYVGKRRGKPGAGQESINRRLILEARRGRRVVRLKGGDPSIFGRAGEELDALRAAGVRTEVVPGVTAALAAAAAARVSLTRRGVASSVAFTVGHDRGRLPAPSADTLAYYMAAGTLTAVARRLRRARWPADTPVALVRAAFRPGGRVRFATLGSLSRSAARWPPPVTLLIGRAVRPSGEPAEHPQPRRDRHASPRVHGFRLRKRR